MAKQKFHAFTFVVSGGGRFPVDMMRYDRCVPKTQADVSMAFALGAADGANAEVPGTEFERSLRSRERRVELIAFKPVGHDLKPSDHWASFGWTVDPTSVRVLSD